MTHEEGINRARQIDKLFCALVDDVIEASKTCEQREDEFSKRSYVRTVFAFVEGIIQVMKSSAILFDELNNPPLLNADEVALLKEKESRITNAGEVKSMKSKISLLPNLQFALRTYARVIGHAVDLDKSSSGWQSLVKAVNIRDRLTHPKTLEDLHISDGDVSTVERAMIFFRDTTGQLLHV